MKLVIDIGNTQVKHALFEDNRIERIFKSSEVDVDFINNIIITKQVSSVIISSVREKIEWMIEPSPILLSYKTNLPIKLNYNTLKTLGNDRIANCVAASMIFPNRDILVIDAGSCITMDFIDKDKVFHGGRISPGLEMRYKSLNVFTDNLPKLEISPVSRNIGKSTDESIISGVQRGVLSEVKEIIYNFKKEKEDLFVIVTGGDTFFFEKELKNSIFADQDLVLKGLNEILKYNE